MKQKRSYFRCLEDGDGYLENHIVIRTITNTLDANIITAQSIEWFNNTTKAIIDPVPSSDRISIATPTGTTSDGSTFIAKKRRLYGGDGQSNMVGSTGADQDVINGATDSPIDNLYMWTGNSGNPVGTFEQADLASARFGDKIEGLNNIVFQAARAWVLEDSANREAYVVISGEGGTSLERRIGTDADLFLSYDENMKNAKAAINDPNLEIVLVRSQVEAENDRDLEAVRVDRQEFYKQLYSTEWCNKYTKIVEIAAKADGDDNANVVLQDTLTDGNPYTTVVGVGYEAVGSNANHYSAVDQRALGLLVHDAFKNMEEADTGERYRPVGNGDSLIMDLVPIDGTDLLYNRVDNNHARVKGNGVIKQGRFITDVGYIGDYTNRASFDRTITFLSGEAWAMHVVAKITAADTTNSRNYLAGRYDNQNVLAPSGGNDVVWPRKINGSSWEFKIRDSVGDYITWDDSVVEAETGDIDMDGWVIWDVSCDTSGNATLFVNGVEVSTVAAGMDTASLVLLSTGTAENGDTVTIGSTTYTFKTTLASAYDVKIGATNTESLENLMAAINDSGTEGTNYGTGTVAHTKVEGISVGAVTGGVALVINGLADTDRAVPLGENAQYLTWRARVTSGGTAMSFNALGFDFKGEIKEFKLFSRTISQTDVDNMRLSATSISNMTSAERIAIVAPYEGMLVFDTSADSMFVYTSAGWAAVCAVPSTTSGTGTGRDPSFYGLKAWSVIPEVAGTNMTTTAGTIYGARIKVDNETTINNICTRINATATGITGCYMGVYNEAGTLIASTANDTVNASAIGDWVNPVITPTTINAGDVVILAFLSVGSTATLIRSGGSQVNSFGFSATDAVFFTADTGATTLPSTLGSKTKSANSFFMAIS